MRADRLIWLGCWTLMVLLPHTLRKAAFCTACKLCCTAVAAWSYWLLYMSQWAQAEGYIPYVGKKQAGLTHDVPHRIST